MTRTTWIAAGIAVALWASFGCQPDPPNRVDADDVKRESEEALGTARDYASEEASEFIAESERTFARLEKEAERLKAEAEDLSAEARTNAQKELAELEVKTKEARRRLDDLKDEGDAAWKDFKKGAESALEDLRDAYDRAASRLRDES